MGREEADKLYIKSLRELEEAGANMRCAELTKILEKLGFTVRNGKRGGHRLFTHLGLPGFLGGSFDCGHGNNDEVKRFYVRSVRNILQEYDSQIKEYLRGQKL